jgi:hypothetical protein
MSTTPPDRPTERLQPSPPPRQPAYEERAGDPGLALLRLQDTVGSLRTGLMIVGVIAVAALAVAAYALIQNNDSGTGAGGGVASDSRVSELDDRIDRISRQVQELRDGGGDEGGASGGAPEERIAALERTVKSLADRPSTDPQQAIDQLSDRIDDVAQDVEALKQAQPAP